MQIAERRVASIHYTLTDEKGAVLDSSRGHEPLVYLHGAGNLVPGLEKALAGKQRGEKFVVTIAPEEGYGRSQPHLIQKVPRSAFGEIANVEVGMRFVAESDRGPMAVVVTHVDSDTVTVDGNHELADTTLHFDVEITDVRDATVEEVLHGHVHGAGGHHHD